MLIDLHVHENIFSPCSGMSLEDAVSAARAAGLHGLCVTDHDSMGISSLVRGYLRYTDFSIFVGVEASTREGHMIAFGLDALPEGMRPLHTNAWGSSQSLRPAGRPLITAQEFIDYVNLQGGFCYCSHPFRLTGHSLGHHLRALTGLHGVEVYNGGNTSEENAQAVQACQSLGLIPLSGSDAHECSEVGRYAIELPEPVASVSELVAQLRSGLCRPVARTPQGGFVPCPLS